MRQTVFSVLCSTYLPVVGTHWFFKLQHWTPCSHLSQMLHVCRTLLPRSCQETPSICFCRLIASGCMCYGCRVYIVMPMQSICLHGATGVDTCTVCQTAQAGESFQRQLPGFHRVIYQFQHSTAPKVLVVQASLQYLYYLCVGYLANCTSTTLFTCGLNAPA